MWSSLSALLGYRTLALSSLAHDADNLYPAAAVRARRESGGTPV
jgi:hypothetical protein